MEVEWEGVVALGTGVQVKIFCGQEDKDPPGGTRKASQRCRTHFVCDLRFLSVNFFVTPDMAYSSVSWLTSNLSDFLLGQISPLRHLLLHGKTCRTYTLIGFNYNYLSINTYVILFHIHF